MSPKAEDSAHFGKRLLPRFHVSQPESHGHHVELPRSERQVQGIGLNEVAHPLLSRHLQHGQTEIRANDGRARAGLPERPGEITAACRKIEDFDRFPPLNDLCGPPTPKKIEPPAEQVVGDVIALRNRRKQPLDRQSLARRGRRTGVPKIFGHASRHRVCSHAGPTNVAELPTAPMSRPLLPKARILVVDDEPSNVRLLERMLDLFGGIEYRCTTDPREAVSLFAEFQPDLVLTDLHMPHLDGYQLMSQFQQLIPDDSFLPIVVLTADITAETRRKALATGASDFITKPLDTTEVQLRLRNLLENRFLNVRLEDQVRQRTSELEDALQQLQAAQQQVVKQERLSALGMMAGGIAHDFNN